jgi:hypothetical protein
LIEIITEGRLNACRILVGKFLDGSHLEDRKPAIVTAVGLNLWYDDGGDESFNN